MACGRNEPPSNTGMITVTSGRSVSPSGRVAIAASSASERARSPRTASGTAPTSCPSVSSKPGSVSTMRRMKSYVCRPACGSCDMVVNAAARSNATALVATNDEIGPSPKLGVAIARSGSDRGIRSASAGWRCSTAFSRSSDSGLATSGTSAGKRWACRPSSFAVE